MTEPTGLCGERCLAWEISGDYACEDCPTLKDLETELIGPQFDDDDIDYDYSQG